MSKRCIIFPPEFDVIKEDDYYERRRDEGRYERHEGRDEGRRDEGRRDEGIRDDKQYERHGVRHGERDKGSRDKGTRDKGARDKGTRDKGTRDKGTRDKGTRDKGDKGDKRGHTYNFSLRRLTELLHDNSIKILYRFSHVPHTTTSTSHTRSSSHTSATRSYIYFLVYSRKLFDTFLIYIPSKYIIDVELETAKDVHIYATPSLYEDEDDEDIVIANMKSVYKELSKLEKTKLIGEAEEKNTHDVYKNSITLSTSNTLKETELKKCIKNIRRYIQPMKKLKYKISLITPYCLCVINDENKIDAYMLDRPVIVKNDYLVVVNIESILDSENLDVHINEINTGFTSILNLATNTHIETIQKVTENIKIFIASVGTLEKMKAYLHKTIQDLIVLISKKDQEIEINNKNLIDIKHKKQSYGSTGEAHLSFKLKNAEEIKDKLKSERSDAILLLDESRTKLKHLYIETDNYLFDSAIQALCLAKSLKSIGNLIHE